MRLPLAITLKNKTTDLTRDARLLNTVVDSKGRVQKRPSLVGAFGPVTVGNGLGLFVRNTPIGGTATPELIAITGSTLTSSPGPYGDSYNVDSVAITGSRYGFSLAGIFNGQFGSITPTTLNGASITFILVRTTNNGTTFGVNGHVSQTFFDSITWSGTTLYSADATFSHQSASFDFSQWTWTSPWWGALEGSTTISIAS